MPLVFPFDLNIEHAATSPPAEPERDAEWTKLLARCCTSY
jgi:hypothetical protein